MRQFHQVTETPCISVPLNEKEKNPTFFKLPGFHIARDGVHDLTPGPPCLQIMRLMRCLLRYGGRSPSPVPSSLFPLLHLLFLKVPGVVLP